MAEKKPIIQVWFLRRKEAWYRLSKEEHDGILDKIRESRDKVGVKRIMPGCRCRWSGAEWQDFGVWEFPNIEAVQKFDESLREMRWDRYVEAKRYLGTPH